eukprot:4493426-Pyramimonas_sp.AAC.1
MCSSQQHEAADGNGKRQHAATAAVGSSNSASSCTKSVFHECPWSWASRPIDDEKQHAHNLEPGADFLGPRQAPPAALPAPPHGAFRAPGRGAQRGSTKSARASSSLCSR